MNNLDKYLSILTGEVDGLLLTSRYSRHYGAEFDIAEGAAIVTKAGCRYFTDSRYIESAQNSLKGFEVICVDGIGYFKLLNDAIADFGVTTLGYEENAEGGTVTVLAPELIKGIKAHVGFRFTLWKKA